MPDHELKEEDIINKSNVKDWIQIGGFLIAAQLTIIALVWQAKPSSGIYWVTFILMLSFAFFVNSIFSNSKAHFLINLVESANNEEKKKAITKKIKIVMNYGYHTFNFGYTLILVGFTLLAYKYMIDFIGKQLLVLLLPIIFIVFMWILLVSYTFVKTRGDPIFTEAKNETESEKDSEDNKKHKFLNELFEPHKLISVLIEFGCLIFITFDFFGILTIV